MNIRYGVGKTFIFCRSQPNSAFCRFANIPLAVVGDLLDHRARHVGPARELAPACSLVELVEDHDGCFVVVVRREIPLGTDIEAERRPTVPLPLGAARGDSLAGVLSFDFGFEFGERRGDSSRTRACRGRGRRDRGRSPYRGRAMQHSSRRRSVRRSPRSLAPTARDVRPPRRSPARCRHSRPLP